MKTPRGGFAPIIVCDHCGRRIDDAKRGAVVCSKASSSEALRDVFHVHKGDCHDAMDASGSVETGWDELSWHVRYLVANTGLTLEELIEGREIAVNFAISSE